jgi:carbonic anhydrase
MNTINKNLSHSLVAILLSAASGSAFAGGATWSYANDTGPDKWGELSPDWSVCGNGHYQSPIDLRDGIDARLKPVEASIKPTALRYGLDGPTFAVPYESGSMIKVNGTLYELQQFHFHHTSEHTVNGKHFPMEAHLVLKSEGSNHSDAVMGVFIKAGKENAMLNQFWDQLPRAKHKTVPPIQVDVGKLLPDNKAYYLYEGSMTTPGCPQGVRWFVLEHPVEASQGQIDGFIADLTEGSTNNRPVQLTWGRAILKGK